MALYTSWCILLGFTGHVLLTNPSTEDKFFASLIFCLCLFGIVLYNYTKRK